jgi:CBS domain-containing protein
MREHQVRKLPVVMRGRLVGMVTHDVAGSLA